METYQDRPCRDTECSGIATAEQDGDHCVYWACPECGFEFGYVMLGEQSDDPSCQAGIPLSVRQAAAGQDSTQGLPLLQIGRRPDA